MFIQYKIMSTTHHKQAALFCSPYSLDSTSCKLTTEQIITHEKLKPLYIALMGELGETPSYDAVVEEGCVREGVVKTLAIELATTGGGGGVGGAQDLDLLLHNEVR